MKELMKRVEAKAWKSVPEYLLSGKFEICLGHLHDQFRAGAQAMMELLQAKVPEQYQLVINAQEEYATKCDIDTWITAVSFGRSLGLAESAKKIEELEKDNAWKADALKYGENSLVQLQSKLDQAIDLVKDCQFSTDQRTAAIAKSFLARITSGGGGV